MKFTRICQLLFIATALVALAGCNTFRGMGRDIEVAGEEIQEEAAEAQN